MTGLTGRILFRLALAVLFLLPLLGWISAEPVPFEDPEGYFSVTPPEGWKTDDSGYMGPGVVMKGPAGKTGVEPVVHMTHQAAGIVTLDVQWHTRLGQIRYDLERVKFLGLEDHQDESPPYGHARYSYLEGEREFLAMVRLYRDEGRFFLFTAAAPKEEFDALAATFLAVFDSFRPGAGN